MVWAALLIFIRLLPAPAAWGAHCPTAIVQVIQTPEGLRAPAPGDKEFEQCQCAEKQAGKKLSEEGSVVTLLMVPPFLGCPAAVEPLPASGLPQAPMVQPPFQHMPRLAAVPAFPPPRLS